ncbi:hypothetical protein Y1Q_0003733 [Alligator mississippiensis]|uniref:Uncharacterized protein n=1 Tax=Alligator mississippiensis TaxID=8496 RepID=A0A151MN51_ALLMI|nr:hypothetical protein Y1Q_0003733 [Alligator mississippiensis]
MIRAANRLPRQLPPAPAQPSGSSPLGRSLPENSSACRYALRPWAGARPAAEKTVAKTWLLVTTNTVNYLFLLIGYQLTHDANHIASMPVNNLRERKVQQDSLTTEKVTCPT